MSTGSTSRTRFRRASETGIWLPLSSGVAPPTMEVLPPCGTRAAPAAAQRRTASASSAVLAGRSRQGALPR